MPGEKRIFGGQFAFELRAIRLQVAVVDSCGGMLVFACSGSRKGASAPLTQRKDQEGAAHEEKRNRHQPRQQGETLPRRRPYDLRSVAAHEVLDDLLLGSALPQLLPDDGAHLRG